VRPPARLTVEQCAAFRVTELTRAGVFRAAPGTPCFCQWTDSRRLETWRAAFRLVRQYGGDLNIHFDYRVASGFHGPQRVMTDAVPVTSTPCRFGGFKWWFHCPNTLNGTPCGRRVRVLYARPNESHFACRKCLNLTYDSAQMHDKRIDALLRRPAEEVLRLLHSGAMQHGALRLRICAAWRRRIQRKAARYAWLARS
jgi:hypothetical protein